MTKDVLIKVLSTQSLDGESDTVELNVRGQMIDEENEIRLVYCEDLEDFGHEDTEIIVKDDSVLIIRKGSMSSEMLLRQGERNTTFYSTPYGDFTIGLYSSRVSVTGKNYPERICLSYTLDFNNGFVSDNNLDIYIEES
ncbi:MAG: DUF1934 domain-containing protein [Clostridiales bacterium]|nr:DUF1934 domain-containing protein [Clostridiales bacterium]